MINPADLQKYVSNVHFPADKSELIQQAEAHGAPSEVMRFFERIPERTYDNPSTLKDEATKVLGGDSLGEMGGNLKDSFKL